MDSSTLGLIGGIAGAVIGVIGGLVGIYFSIKNTSGPQEKAFVIRASLMFLGVCVVVSLIWILLPSPYKVLAFVPCWIMLPFAIRMWNKKQSMIRTMEAQDHTGTDDNTRPH